MDSDPRRTYLAKHGVEAAVTAAITKVLEKQPTDPVSEVGRCLLDSKYAVPAGVTVLPVLQYVTNFGVKAAVSDAIKATLLKLCRGMALSTGSSINVSLLSAIISEFTCALHPIGSNITACRRR